MLPVLTAERLRAADAHTIAHEPITSIDLMERAALRFTDRLMDLHRAGAFGSASRIKYLVVVGMGNNGGDGLVVARSLHEHGMAVRVVRIVHRAEPSADNATNHQRALETGVPCTDVIDPSHLIQITDDEVIIDAVFGTGLNAPLAGLSAEAVAWINTSDRPVLALDMPSGLFAEDNRTNDPKHIVRATRTISLELPRLAFFLPENAPYVGIWESVPIGLDAGFIRDQPTRHAVIERTDLVGLLHSRPQFAHKGSFGHALVVAGGFGHIGAAVLATRAALRSGAGLVTSHVPSGGLGILQTAAPEAMCSVDPSDRLITELPQLGAYSAIGIGPGLGTDEATATAIKRLIQDAPAPLVIDADALNILAQNPTWLAFLPPGTILTPHPKEFDRLVGRTVGSGYQRLELAREVALKNRCIVVLKGAWTAVCDTSGRVFFNSTGNPGMAKGGSGDALTGLLAGLLAQGYPSLSAALLGVYLHGHAGDLAARRLGMDGMIAGDLIEELPEAWRALRRASEQSLQ